MGINLSPDEERATSVTPETYFTFCGLMIAGGVFAFFFVLSPSRVIKSDGTAVVFEQTDAAEGLGELVQVAKLFSNRYMLLLTPLIIQVRDLVMLFFTYDVCNENRSLLSCSQIGSMHMNLEGSMVCCSMLLLVD